MALPSTVSPGRTSRARASRSRTAGVSRSIEPGVGTASGASTYRCSTGRFSAIRLVTSTAAPVAAARSMNPRASSSCSRLSSTSSGRRRPSAANTSVAPPAASRRPNTRPTTSGTNAASRTAPSSTIATSPRRLDATSRASRVLPTPPSPSSVTRAPSVLSRSTSTRATSASRPIKAVVAVLNAARALESGAGSSAISSPRSWLSRPRTSAIRPRFPACGTRSLCSHARTARGLKSDRSASASWVNPRAAAGHAIGHRRARPRSKCARSRGAPRGLPIHIDASSGAPQGCLVDAQGIDVPGHPYLERLLDQRALPYRRGTGAACRRTRHVSDQLSSTYARPAASPSCPRMDSSPPGAIARSPSGRGSPRCRYGRR